MSVRKSRSSVRSFVLGALLVVLVLAGAGFVISQASGPQTVGHAMSSVWCDNPSGCIPTSWLQDLVVTTVKLADNSVSRQKLQADSVDSSKVINASIKAVDVDSSQVQLRVAQNCIATGGSVQSINADGTVTCASGSLFAVATNSVTKSTNGFVVDVSCPPSNAGMVYCDFEYNKGSLPEIQSVKAEMITVGFSSVCRVTMSTSGVDLVNPVTVTAKALCKN